MGSRSLHFQLATPLNKLPDQLSKYGFHLTDNHLHCTIDTHVDQQHISALIQTLNEANIHFTNMHITERRLEDIFVELVT